MRSKARLQIARHKGKNYIPSCKKSKTGTVWLPLATAAARNSKGTSICADLHKQVCKNKKRGCKGMFECPFKPNEPYTTLIECYMLIQDAWDCSKLPQFNSGMAKGGSHSFTG